MRLRADRLLPALGVVALVTMGACAAYSRLAAFRGELAVGVGREEDIVATPGEAALRWTTPGVVQGVPGRLLPFRDPESAETIFSPGDDYSAAQLPHPIGLLEIEVLTAPPARDFLKLDGSGSKDKVAIETGGEVAIGGTRFSVAGVKKWSGLLRDSQGAPMAALSVRVRDPNGWTTVFIASGTWQVIGPEVAVHFQWVESEAAARMEPPGIESARWGIVDGTAVNWFQSFAPGAGVRLSSGEEVTLVGFEERHAAPGRTTPAIAVEVARGGEKSVVWVAANETGADGLVRFEHPALLPHVFVVRAWEEERALAAAFEGGQPAGEKQLRAGQAFHEDAADVNMRLEQVLATATPVSEKASTLWAAVLKTPEGEAVTLRQGEAVRLGDSLVEYVREARAPVLRYRMRMNGEDVTLAPGDSLRVGDWRLQQAGHSREPGAVAVLAADYAPGRRAARALLAVGLTALLLWSMAHTMQKRQAVTKD